MIDGLFINISDRLNKDASGSYIAYDVEFWINEPTANVLCSLFDLNEIYGKRYGKQYDIRHMEKLIHSVAYECFTPFDEQGIDMRVLYDKSNPNGLQRIIAFQIAMLGVGGGGEDFGEKLEAELEKWIKE